MNANEIKKVLDKHLQWVREEPAGERADLREANGIYSFGPIGDSGRIGYAVSGEETMIQLGCHWGNLKDTLKAIRTKYGRNSLYEKQVVLEVKILEEKEK